MTDSGRFQSAVDSLGRARVLAFLLLAGSALSAQEYSFRSYGNAEGLTNLAVQQIYQDHVGFIWVSTDNGIFRFDGERFEAFGQAQGVPSSSSVAFGDGPDGSLLVGGDFGLLRLQGNRFERVPASFKKIETDQGIQTDGMGHTYLGTDSGLVELTSQPGQRAFSVRSFAKPAGTTGPEVFGILAKGNTLWFGCGTELCHRENGQTKVFGEDAGLPKSSITTIRKDGEGNLWVAVKHGGLLVMPTGKSRFQRPDLPAKTLAVVNPPSVDSEGRILLPTSGGLLIREKEGWQSIDPSKGLRGGVYTALEDRQHSMWIGMVGRGLVKWRGYREWETYSTASGLISDVIWEMQTQADGTLWVGTGEGLLRGERHWFGTKWNKVAGLQGFSAHGVRLGPDGGVWVGTETHGLARLKVRTGRVEWFGERQGLRAKDASTLSFDSENRLWVATDVGLFVAAAPYTRFSHVTALPSTRIWAIAEGSDGTIWAGNCDGLYALAGGRWKHFTREDGLSHQEVLSLGVGANGTM